MEVRSPDRIWEGGHVLLVAIAAELALLFLFHRTSAAVEVLIFVIARKMVAPGISGVELLAGVAALAALVAIRFYFIPRTEGGGRDAS
jgi:hypothetical protein